MLECAMKHARRLLCMTAGLMLVLAPAVAIAESRAVIELFTSQGCSSCPPADQLAAELAADPDLIVLTLPVDYWDYLGWKDTLSRPRHTARQRGYAAKRGDREIYTPQVIVNGIAQVIGSDRAAITEAVERTNRNHAALSVPVKLATARDSIEVVVNGVDEPELSGEVWLCAIAHAVPVAIARGENRGRNITYHNVVRRWVRLGSWPGVPQTFSVARSEFDSEGVDSVAV